MLQIQIAHIHISDAASNTDHRAQIIVQHEDIQLAIINMNVLGKANTQSADGVAVADEAGRTIRLDFSPSIVSV